MSISRRRYPLTLAGLFAAWWVTLAIHPLDRSDWLLESALSVAGVAALAALYRRLPFSRV